jgi:hypothetical protein
MTDALNGIIEDLQQREVNEIAQVEGDLAALVQAANDKKDEVLAEIDEQIWKLGYGQPEAFDNYDYSVATADYKDHPIYRAINHPENFAQVAEPIGANGQYSGIDFNFDELFYYPGKNEEHDEVVRNLIIDVKQSLFDFVA